MKAKNQPAYANLKELVQFLEGSRRYYLDLFNYSHPENKSDKWRLLRVEKALKLLEENPDYKIGACIQCGEDIPFQRMIAEPESIWCVDCVKEHERRTMHKGGHWLVPKKTAAQTDKSVIDKLFKYLDHLSLTEFGEIDSNGLIFLQIKLKFPQTDHFAKIRLFLLITELADELKSCLAIKNNAIITTADLARKEDIADALNRRWKNDWPQGLDFILKSKDWQIVLIKELLTVIKFPVIGGWIEKQWAKDFLSKQG